MGCLVALVAVVSPRFAFFLTWVFSDRVTIAFDGSFFLPLVGLFFLPWTALAWTYCYAAGRGVNGFGWFVVVFAFFIDLGSYSSTERERRRRASY